MHAAEGELFRRALSDACSACDVRVSMSRSRDLLARGAEELGVPIEELRRRLTDAGRAIGKPWGQDQKESMLLGWLVLRSANRPSARRA
jgi:hypothetical protein